MNTSEAGMLGYLKAKDKLIAFGKKRSADARDKYEKSPTICKGCDSAVSYEKKRNKFCNSSCSASYNNRIYKRKAPTLCRHCGGEIQKRGNKHCNKCIENGMCFHNKVRNIDDAKTNPTRRKILEEELGHQCQTCKRKTWNGQPIPLELEHIDGNSENNKRKNLTLICPNCHAQTPTYKGKNVGNGRHWRRQRYHEGKSY